MRTMPDQGASCQQDLRSISGVYFIIYWQPRRLLAATPSVDLYHQATPQPEQSMSVVTILERFRISAKRVECKVSDVASPHALPGVRVVAGTLFF